MELRTALDNDMASINADGTVDYVDNSADYAQVPDAPVPVDPNTGEVLEGEIVGEPSAAEAAFFGEG